MKQRRQPNRRGNAGPGRAREVAVLFEDDAILVVDKPAGLPAVPVAKNAKTPSAWSLVATELRERRQRAFVVHRIDRFTSGIMLFAKTERDRDFLVRQFLEHTPVREYLAVVRGWPEPAEGTLVHHFRKEGHLQKLSSPRDKQAARAELRYCVEERLTDASLLRVALVTGLQNQIRVQFAAIGHPVFGDRKYHPAEATERRIQRVALHAVHLEFTHPRNRKTTVVDCAPPKDFISLVGTLSTKRKH